MSTTSASPEAEKLSNKYRVPLLAMAATVLGALLIGVFFSANTGLLMIIGALFGVVLYHAAFGFTAAWRAFITERRGRGLRAQMVMLAIAVVLFFPALGAGSLSGTPVAGFVAPIGVSVVVGAFIFGLGMQLGGGCASGTLFTAGGGNARMLITLLFFVVGSVIGTAHFAWWQSLPAFAPVSLVEVAGPSVGIAISLVIFAAIAATTLVLERRRHGQLERAPAVTRPLRERWLAGPWPLYAGAVALALLNFATLALAGRPWGITSAFALWGAKVFEFIGGDVSQWGYWQSASNEAALNASIFSDITTVMNIGIMLGALAAAHLAGRFAPNFNIPIRSVVAAILGGLMLGYGARLAFGCNIGAYFSGIASGSLHGWVWMAAAFAGNMLGVKMRPLFFAGVEGRKPKAKTA
ncbi:MULTISPECIES: YeeE/YedE family protein [unclassified Halomonas]|uniref:YeeE/YedE family protein n=1 Tax=unclassified Halomonas TaxID=2609666 RepID=UPI0021E43410|nr:MULTISPECIES: YeeE/YedE family protein [unclassified Halomonas]UYF99400.1 YeeE/YedE family protein [Halomonas sp. GD1P12]WNL39485.1 YeeE/YedE family protein [Halomonas sp. PAMB 3232]WNL42854.1 YeeE/YedE family protein [Halomonas sp. PAMB 3264]